MRIKVEVRTTNKNSCFESKGTFCTLIRSSSRLFLISELVFSFPPSLLETILSCFQSKLFIDGKTDEGEILVSSLANSAFCQLIICGNWYQVSYKNKRNLNKYFPFLGVEWFNENAVNGGN